MSQAALLLELFAVFFVIGLFTFGGGYAIISLIQSQVVVARGWISQSVFTDIVAISQMTPGPIGLNCSTYVGYEVLKDAGAGELAATAGSLTASLAIVLPSFMIMLAIVKFYTRFHENGIFKGVMSGLRPAVAGLIGAAAMVLMFNVDFHGISVIAENFPDWKAWALAAAAFCASLFAKASPIWIIFCGGLLGLLIY